MKKRKKWKVEYNLTYKGGMNSQYTWYYRFWITAKIGIMWNKAFASGWFRNTAVLSKREGI